MRALALAVATVFAAALFPASAQAGGVWTVTVRNETDHCAWITVYHTHGLMPPGWSIAGSGWAPATAMQRSTPISFGKKMVAFNSGS
jgi:hypothetical protein